MIAWGPMIRSIYRMRGTFLSIVLEVAFGSAVVFQAFVLGAWYLDRGGYDSGMDEARTFHVEVEGAAADAKSALLSLPGVEGAEWVEAPPWVHAPAYDVLDGRHPVWLMRGGPNLPAALGLELRAGTGFQMGAPHTSALISASLAERLFGGAEEAVGRTMQASLQHGELVVTGVFERLMLVSPTSLRRDDVMLLSATQPAGLRRESYLVRVARPEAAAFPARAAGAVPAHWVRAQPIGVLRRLIDAPRYAATAVVSAVVLVIALGAVLGTFGLSAFLVSERTRQIGIRRALGATRGDILRYFLVESWLLTTIGLVLGLAISAALTALGARLMPGLALDARIVAGGVVLYWATGVAAALIPALRASRIPPVVATKTV